MPRSDIEERLRDFAIDEGVLGKKLPANPKLDFAYEIKFPPQSPKPMKLILIKPKSTKAVTLQAPTQISPQHMKAFKQQGQQGLFKFFTILKKYVLTQNLLYNISVKDARYIILDSIYPDGLTEDRFYLSVRKVFNAAVFMNLTLNEILSGIIPANGKLKEMPETEFDSGHSMFA